MKKNNLKFSILFLFIALNCASVFLSGEAQAFFADSEKSKKNNFEAGVLDMILVGAKPFILKDARGREILFENFFLKNKGTVDFVYSAYIENKPKSLCNGLHISATVDGKKVFEGSLKNFFYSGFLKADDKADWKLKLDIVNGDWDEKCKFDIVFKAWQKNLSFKQGWNDEERISGNEIIFASKPKKTVVINEIMWMGSTVSSSDEWIELRNLSDDKVDIGGWEIENAKRKGEDSLKILGGKSIEPRGYFLISNYSDESENSALAVGTDEVNSSISLSNSENGNLILRDEDGNIIDQALGSQWPVGENGDKKKSMERINDPGDGLDENNWNTCEDDVCVSEEYWDEAGDNFGTPGGKNSDAD